MRKGGMIAGGAVAVIGLFLMSFQRFRGISLPFIGEVGYYVNPYSQLGLYMLIAGLVILVGSAAIPSPKPPLPTLPPPPYQAPQEKPREVIKVRCPSCGNLNLEDAKFCSFCGKQLK